MKDTYKTIVAPTKGEFKDRGSKFIAYAFPAYDEDTIKEHLETVKKEHFKARHHCYAYRIGLGKTNFRANDDGEPSGTAGRPILGQLDSFEVTNVFVVVVRYFGGTKLGASGLINAYRAAAADALAQAEIIEKTVDDVFEIIFDYSIMSEIMGFVKNIDIEIIQQEFTDKGRLKVAIRKSETDGITKQLRATAAKVRIEQIDEIKTIHGFELISLGER